MQCAFCKEAIDDDSCYCDLCGEEVKRCTACGKTGKGKICTACGNALIAAKGLPSPVDNVPVSASSSSIGTGTTAPKAPTDATATSAPRDLTAGGTVRASNDSISATPVLPELHLMNKNLSIDVLIKNNSIVGRTSGNYINIFGAYDQISGKHCRFSFDTSSSWCVTDLGSTNGTKLNNVPISPNDPKPLKDKMFLKIGNIEFYVQIR